MEVLARRAMMLAAVAVVLGSPAAVSVAAAQTLTEGEQLISQRNWDEAEKHYYKIVKNEPQNAEALRKLAFVELRRPGGDAVRALKYLDKAVSLEPEDAIGLFLLGKAYQVTGQLPKAAETFDRLIELGPGRDDPQRAGAVHLARFNRGFVALKQKDYDTAKDLFFEVIRREPHHGYVLYEQGHLAAESGKPDQAIQHFEEAVSAYDHWVPTETWPYPQGRYAYMRENARFELGKALLAADRPQEAKKVLEPIVQQVELRSDVRQRALDAPQPAPLQGETDERFENAPYYYAEALAELGEDKAAIKAFKNFSRLRVGDGELRSQARKRAKEVKRR
jgi:tetratricopeptide (TPR) repeat protein